MHCIVTILIIVSLLFSEEMTELKIQIETGFETEQDLKKSLQQLEGKKNYSTFAYSYLSPSQKCLADHNSSLKT